MNKLFVGNLSWTTTEDDLKTFFEQCGKVVSVKIVTDKNTGKSKGFGFVEMENGDAANAAIQELNGKQLLTRELRVSLAQERQGGPAGGGQGRPPRGDRPERRDFRSKSDYGNGRPAFNGPRGR